MFGWHTSLGTLVSFDHAGIDAKGGCDLIFGQAKCAALATNAATHMLIDRRYTHGTRPIVKATLLIRHPLMS